MNWQEARETLLKPLIDQPRSGIVTDVDGTVSPIAQTPGAAQVTPRNRELLRQLYDHFTLVSALSGRGVLDLRDRVGIPELTYVGNHGMERWQDGGVQVDPEIAAYRDAVSATLAELEPHMLPGMRVEDKNVTASVHYRQAEDHAAVQTEFGPRIEQTVKKHGLTLFKGRQVYEVRPPVKVNKGTAFAGLVREFKLDAAFYIGDDTTDADALRVARQLREQGVCHAVAIGVESADMPQVVVDESDVLVAGVPDVEAFFDWLLTARMASST